MSKLAAIGLLCLVAVAGLWFGYQHWEGSIRADERSKVTAEFNSLVDAQKSDARKKLDAARETARRETQALTEQISQLEQARENLQSQNNADRRTRAAAPRLQFVTKTSGCGDGGRDAKAPAPGPTGDPGPAVVQLPEQINSDLLDLGADAQSLSIDYGVLYRYVNNPKLVCELRP